MKFIHISDVHANRERIDAIKTVFDCIIDTVTNNDVDFVLFSGDFWDSTITNTRASGFTDYITMVNKLSTLCKVIFIYGTPKHEPKGALDVFEAIGCTVIDTPQRIEIDTKSGCVDILAIPEPRRGDYVGLSTEETTKAINQSYIELAKNVKGDNPFIVAFHGEVAGSIYDNGIEAKSSIQFPVNLFKEMKADYYAFGHIHLPQEVFENAYYPGSPAPLDFGEKHDGVIHLVTIEENTSVEKIRTSAPWFITIELDYSALEKFDPKEYEGNHLRVIVNNAADNDSPHKIVSSIKEKADLLSCKVILNKEVKSKTRESNIANRITTVEKYEEYCKIQNCSVGKHAKEFLQSIDDNKMLFQSHPSKSFELQSISLRGAIGIKCGSGKDEIFIDFSNYQSGVVAMVGNNGRGKTTIIENCHPYPRMLTRKDVLKKHFMLKDSHRILVYRCNDGTYLKIAMLIDGKTKTGSVSYFAYESKDGTNWKPCIDTDGSLDAYNKFLERTFGDIELFIRTSFFTRKETKGTPDLTTATKGEKIEFFSSLAGNDWLVEVSELAKDAVSYSKKEQEQLELKIESAESARIEIDECVKELEKLEESILAEREELKEVDKLVAELETYEKKRIELQAIADSNAFIIEQEQSRLEKLEEYLESLYDDKKTYDAIQSHKDELNAINLLFAENSNLKSKIDNLKNTILEKSISLDKLKDQLTGEMQNVYSLEMLAKNLEHEIDNHKNMSVECSDLCPLCGSELSIDKSEYINEIAREHQHEVAELEIQQSLLCEKIADANVITKKLSEQVDAAAKEKENAAEILSQIEARLQEIGVQIDDKGASIHKATGLSYIELSLNTDMEFDESSIESTSNEIDSVKKKIDGISNIETLPSKDMELADAKGLQESIKTSIATYTGEKNAINARLERLNEDLIKVVLLESELKEVKSKLDELSHVQSAFSKTGIPLMELESAIPHISSLTNDILNQSHGDRFTISFETVRQGNKKEVDDLNIVVYDSQQGMSKYLDMVCSGEEVWIKQALFYAFSIVRMNRTGFSFATRFIDESDSSIDTVSRSKYLSMIEAAHRLAGARLSVLITHSQEIKDIAEQIIEV